MKLKIAFMCLLASLATSAASKVKKVSIEDLERDVKTGKQETFFKKYGKPAKIIVDKEKSYFAEWIYNIPTMRSC